MVLKADEQAKRYLLLVWGNTSKRNDYGFHLSVSAARVEVKEEFSVLPYDMTKWEAEIRRAFIWHEYLSLSVNSSELYQQSCSWMELMPQFQADNTDLNNYLKGATSTQFLNDPVFQDIMRTRSKWAAKRRPPNPRALSKKAIKHLQNRAQLRNSNSGFNSNPSRTSYFTKIIGFRDLTSPLISAPKLLRKKFRRPKATGAKIGGDLKKLLEAAEEKGGASSTGKFSSKKKKKKHY